MSKPNNGILCDESGCEGVYQGPEFAEGRDVAHQFSNRMSAAVGDKLKELYRSEQYKKVDFAAIEMSTDGMGSGTVTYQLKIPFSDVGAPCDAFTSFDHVGGWNHRPALNRRKTELQNVTLPGHSLFISDLKNTPEGLQEYWIQWKNKETQSGCE
ncbi:hypothetical protein [Nonlabens spongiae]|nr:hypothetical protein [Nonlabens spongiae]